MANIYLNNQPAGSSGSLTWGTGSDSNDGLTPATPKLTANAAFQLYDDAPQDGDTLFINDGDYVFNALDGRWIIGHESSNIQPMNDYATAITFSGTNTQGLRYNLSTSEVRNHVVGKIVIKTSSEKIYGLYSSGSSTNLADNSITCAARFVPNSDGTADASTRFGYYDTCGSGSVVINGGGVSAADGSLVDISGEAYEYRPYYQAPTVSLNSSVPAIVNITEWALNIKLNMTDLLGVIDIAIDSAYPANSTINVSGVTGTVIANNTNASMVYLVRMHNQPDNTSVNNNTVTFSALNNSGAGGILLLGKDFDSLNNVIDGNNLTINTDSGSGFGLTMGAEGTDGLYSQTSGDITNNQLAYTNTGSSSNGVHGINHIYAEGTRSNNTVTGVAIGSLTKASGATSSGNTYTIEPLSSSKVYLYAKGAYAGASFSNETLISTPTYTGNFIQALKDDTTGGADAYCDNTTFADITIQGDVSADATIFSVGFTAGDNSTATLTNVTLPTDAATLTVYGQESEVTYSTIVDVNSLSWVTNINQPSGVAPIYTVCSLTVSNSYQSTQFQASTICPLGRDWGTKRYTSDGVIIPNYIHGE